MSGVIIELVNGSNRVPCDLFGVIFDRSPDIGDIAADIIDDLVTSAAEWRPAE
jgi:hypothetical protein